MNNTPTGYKNEWPNTTDNEIREIASDLRSMADQLLEETKSKSTFTRAADLLEWRILDRRKDDTPCPKCGSENVIHNCESCKDCGTSWSL